MLLAGSRHNVSCAIRFSEPPVSIEARDELMRLVRQFLQIPDEGLLPVKVFSINSQEQAWLDDRAGRIDSFHDDNTTAKHKRSKLFNVSCSVQPLSILSLTIVNLTGLQLKSLI
ncbi:unnamed protein product [Strongylus vulgaris]|uniref:Uncharacterized protein n=1 Tax=Strongylus vulgaris TaxID=40348 RepID=A0A3P7IRJ8_STRVU|nr:unnamed protein product [Strongylus vulgaris]